MDSKDSLEKEKFLKSSLGQLRKGERGRGSASSSYVISCFSLFLNLNNPYFSVSYIYKPDIETHTPYQVLPSP